MKDSKPNQTNSYFQVKYKNVRLIIDPLCCDRKIFHCYNIFVIKKMFFNVATFSGRYYTYCLFRINLSYFSALCNMDERLPVNIPTYILALHVHGPRFTSPIIEPLYFGVHLLQHHGFCTQVSLLGIALFKYFIFRSCGAVIPNLFMLVSQFHATYRF